MRLAKDQMNLKAKIKQLQAAKNVSLYIWGLNVKLMIFCHVKANRPFATNDDMYGTKFTML